MKAILLSAVAAAMLIPATPVLASAPSDPGAYPLSTCIVSGEVLEDGESVTKEINGREVRLCCDGCARDLAKDPDKFLGALDQAVIEAQLPDYPLDTCIISGEELGGEMGDPVNYLVGNRLVRLCCNMCKAKVDADPAAAIAKLDAAVVAAQSDAYPATACPISGKALGSMGDPIDYVFAGKLVRFCCAGCIPEFNKDPVKNIAVVYGTPDAATTAEGSDHDHDDHDHDHDGHGH